MSRSKLRPTQGWNSIHSLMPSPKDISFVNTSSIFCFLFFSFYLFLRESVWAGEGQREGTEDLKGPLRWQQRDHDLSQSQIINRLSHSCAPFFNIFLLSWLQTTTRFASCVRWLRTALLKSTLFCVDGAHTCAFLRPELLSTQSCFGRCHEFPDQEVHTPRRVLVTWLPHQHSILSVFSIWAASGGCTVVRHCGFNMHSPDD